MPFTPTAPMCICPPVGEAIVCVTVIENVLVVLLNESTAVPVAVELLPGTSLAPSNVALNVVMLGPGLGLESLLLHEAITDTKIEITNNLIKVFIRYKI